ncbi:acyl-CoA thioesterase [Pseudodonghicola flavimaris]|uniref:Acyl-CoA thioesterase n=1 Tax=Pseudodonghicola flavimaris TaxID=3050036 RepID=A0ABT7F5G7_9RHOB|nr:acyl-CoA thioesterase [Pseudodonghicola flavimaris]MDK3019841.1 acyl-CoA thioesterase [Pseudodonghicola flavimaris]
MTQEIECYRGVVHPWLCDAMGHMTTRHYTAMFDDGSYHLLAELGFGPEMLARRQGFADVNLNMTMQAELAAGDLTVVSGRVIRIGGKSMVLGYSMRNRTTGDLAAELIATTVQFDLEARRAIEVLPVIRDTARRLFPEAEIAPGSAA